MSELAALLDEYDAWRQEEKDGEAADADAGMWGDLVWGHEVRDEWREYGCGILERLVAALRRTESITSSTSS